MKSRKFWAKLWRNKGLHKKRKAFISYNFADVEADTNIIQNIVSAAGKAAAAEAKAVGIPKVYASKNEIILEEVNGEHKILSSGNAAKPFFIKYYKKRILRARAK